MICPLRSMQWREKPDVERHDQLLCLKEECAWWDGELKDCLIMTVAVALTGICGFLMKVEKKMPHAGQFTK